MRERDKAPTHFCLVVHTHTYTQRTTKAARKPCVSGRFFFSLRLIKDIRGRLGARISDDRWGAVTKGHFVPGLPGWRTDEAKKKKPTTESTSRPSWITNLLCSIYICTCTYNISTHTWNTYGWNAHIGHWIYRQLLKKNKKEKKSGENIFFCSSVFPIFKVILNYL